MRLGESSVKWVSLNAQMAHPTSSRETLEFSALCMVPVRYDPLSSLLYCLFPCITPPVQPSIANKLRNVPIYAEQIPNRSNSRGDRAVINCEYSMATFSTGERKEKRKGDRCVSSGLQLTRFASTFF